MMTAASPRSWPATRQYPQYTQNVPFGRGTAVHADDQAADHIDQAADHIRRILKASARGIDDEEQDGDDQVAAEHDHAESVPGDQVTGLSRVSGGIR
jgi:hypothetical protein